MITSRSIPIQVGKLVKQILRKLKRKPVPINVVFSSQEPANVLARERTLHIVPTKKNSQIIGLNWLGLRIDEEKRQVVPSVLRKFQQFAEEESKNISIEFNS